MQLIIFCICFISIRSSLAAPIGLSPSKSIPSIFEKSNSFFDGHKPLFPELFQISIKKLKSDSNFNDEEYINQDERQIPVISDIERIKKVIEIIEFVEEKVGDLIDKIQVENDPDEPNDSRSSENSTIFEQN